MFSFSEPFIGLWLLKSPAEAPPSLWQGASSAASPLCPLTVIGNSVPPKEPPLLRCKAPPPKHLTTSIKEPDPINYLLPSCRHWLQQWLCQLSSYSRVNYDFANCQLKFGKIKLGGCWRLPQTFCASCELG